MSKFLRESQSGIERVDTEAGIIYGVKVLGPRSRNGRVYEDSAIRKALPLYEGVTVNINHVRPDPKTGAHVERPMQDRWGVLRNARYQEGSIYADLHYIKSHPMTKQLVEAAQRFPEIFGLSHDAGGDEQLIDGERRVVEMYEVKSVDVVADPATNEGLFESYRPVDPARARAARKKARLSLYETRDGDGDGKINDGKSSEGPAPPKKASSKLSQADRISRAERRAARYDKMADKLYDKGNDLISQSNQVWGPQSDKLYAKGNAIMRKGDPLTTKATTIRNAIKKVSAAEQPKANQPVSSVTKKTSKTELNKIQSRKKQIGAELLKIESDLEAKIRKLKGDKFTYRDMRKEWEANEKVKSLEAEEDSITKRELDLARQIKGSPLTSKDMSKLAKGVRSASKPKA